VVDGRTGEQVLVTHDPRPPAEAFAVMALALHEEKSFETTVDRVLALALKDLDCTYACLVVVHGKDRIETAAATSDLVADLDRSQLTSGRGPDIDLLDSQRGVIVHDTLTEERWPDWAALVAQTGIRSMLGARLCTATQTIGSLDLYDVRTGRFGEDDLERAHVLARHAAVALDSARTRDNLWQAIGSRHRIGMAQGILMERFAIDADEAIAVLRRYSQDGNLKLHAVAEHVVDSRRLPGEA
jgi:GAF domain-containing protein